MTRPTWYQCQQRHNVEVLLFDVLLSPSCIYISLYLFLSRFSRNRCINPAPAVFLSLSLSPRDARIVLPSFTHTHSFIITGSVSIQANLQSTEAWTNNGVTNLFPSHFPSFHAPFLSLSIPVLWNRVNRVVSPAENN